MNLYQLGYGQNFLVGKGLAKNATHEVLKKHASAERRKAENEAQELADLKVLAEKLDKVKVTITKKLGNTGHLFGAVTKEEIAQALQDQHALNIDKKHINHKEAIKSTGLYDLDFKLGHGMHGTIHLEVIGE